MGSECSACSQHGPLLSPFSPASGLCRSACGLHQVPAAVRTEGLCRPNRHPGPAAHKEYRYPSGLWPHCEVIRMFEEGGNKVHGNWHPAFSVRQASELFLSQCFLLSLTSFILSGAPCSVSKLLRSSELFLFLLIPYTVPRQYLHTSSYWFLLLRTPVTATQMKCPGES